MSEKLDKFKNELVALCEKHQIQLTISLNGDLQELDVRCIDTHVEGQQEQRDLLEFKRLSEKFRGAK